MARPPQKRAVEGTALGELWPYWPREANEFFLSHSGSTSMLYVPVASSFS